MRSLVFLALAVVRTVSAQAALPTEWIDSSTGHRVIRLSREDGTQSLYFNQNAYTADGKKLIVTTAGGGIATITLATHEVKPLVAGPVSPEKPWLPFPATVVTIPLGASLRMRLLSRSAM